MLALLVAGCGSTADTTGAPAPAPASGTLTADPSVLTLPTGAFHYDPLLTLRDGNGVPVWADLTTDVKATSSDPGIATVNERVRIRTTRTPGRADIRIQAVSDPAAQTTVKLTTVDASIQSVSLAGPTTFELYVGQGVDIDATAVLSTGDVIPHAEYSSDLDVVTGSEFAAVVDGQGLVALQAAPAGTPINIGFLRGGGAAAGLLSVREMQLAGVDVRLGGLESDGNRFTIPSGYHAVLEVLGTFEDGTVRLLQVNRDYTVATVGDNSFQFTPGEVNGTLSQPVAGRTGGLRIDLRDDIDDILTQAIEVQATTVEGSRVTGLRAEFENFREDNRLVYLGQGYARALRVVADFPGLSGYRVSGLDPLEVSASFASPGRARTGWPTLTPTIPNGAVEVELGLQGSRVGLPGVAAVTPRVLTVAALGKHPVARLPIEMGSHVAFDTKIDYGDGVPVLRTSDYPVLENPDLTPFSTLLVDTTTFFLNRERVHTFRAYDGQGRQLQATGPNAHAEIQVVATRQSNPD